MNRAEHKKTRRRRLHGNLRYLLMLMALCVVGGCVFAPHRAVIVQAHPYYGIFPEQEHAELGYYQGINPGKDLSKRF